MDNLNERVNKLRTYVSFAGKATPIEQLALDLADKIVELESTISGYEAVMKSKELIDEAK